MNIKLLAASAVLVGILWSSVSYASKKNDIDIKKFPQEFGNATKQRLNAIEGAVFHYTLTKRETTADVLRARGFATIYLVCRNGDIFEFVNPDKFYTETTGGGANRFTVGIDLEHFVGQDWPEDQIYASAGLLAYLSDKNKFKIAVAPDGEIADYSEWKKLGYTVFRHRNFLPTECPGDFPLEKVGEIASGLTGS